MTTMPGSVTASVTQSSRERLNSVRRDQASQYTAVKTIACSKSVAKARLVGRCNKLLFMGFSELPIGMSSPRLLCLPRRASALASQHNFHVFSDQSNTVVRAEFHACYQ